MSLRIDVEAKSQLRFTRIRDLGNHRGRCLCDKKFSVSQNVLKVQHELLPLKFLERAATPALASQRNLSCQLTGFSHHTRAAVRTREYPPRDGYKHPVQLSNAVDPMTTASAATL